MFGNYPERTTELNKAMRVFLIYLRNEKLEQDPHFVKRLNDSHLAGNDEVNHVTVMITTL